MIKLTKIIPIGIAALIFSMSSELAYADIKDLKLDPRGRGDGFDITSADFSVQCYADPAMEARRPFPPHPMDVKAEAAQKKVKRSVKLTERALQKRDKAQEAFEKSFKEVLGPPKDNSLSAAFLLSALEEVKNFTQSAYVIAKDMLSNEKEVTIEDFFNNPEAAFSGFFAQQGEKFLTESGFTLYEGSFATDIMDLAMKKALLNKFEDARDYAKRAYDDKKANFGPRDKYWESDPKLKAAYDKAEAAYQRSSKASVRDSKAYIRAERRAYRAPSDLLPCDSPELAKLLDDNFCGPNTPEFFSPAERKNNPVAAKRFDAYLVKVCKAVKGSSSGGTAPPQPPTTPRQSTPVSPNNPSQPNSELQDRADEMERRVSPGRDR